LKALTQNAAVKDATISFLTSHCAELENKCLKLSTTFIAQEQEMIKEAESAKNAKSAEKAMQEALTIVQAAKMVALKDKNGVLERQLESKADLLSKWDAQAAEIVNLKIKNEGLEKQLFDLTTRALLSKGSTKENTPNQNAEADYVEKDLETKIIEVERETGEYLSTIPSENYAKEMKDAEREESLIATQQDECKAAECNEIISKQV
jgi:hypothetical protein